MKVFWLAAALRDRDTQLEYIAAKDPLAAVTQGDRIQGQIDHLAEHPNLGREGRVSGTRELIIASTPFIAVYRVLPRAKRIELIRLLHGAQRWPL
ncbi:type II toxin-antitoxin system RelE/ParE family toxin [Halotalea alkalilenta]|uniref:type II toxin-antitoxin system RelE/ParE family toxin n=1 Tax=Halotalea alkalilenta TaxID=376489 RepID=UPI0009EE19AC|nr:type II toxin-antitoxin system RelE/ParE family toxin [Halotalea alkalilenta]